MFRVLVRGTRVSPNLPKKNNLHIWLLTVGGLTLWNGKPVKARVRNTGNYGVLLGRSIRIGNRDPGHCSAEPTWSDHRCNLLSLEP